MKKTCLLIILMLISFTGFCQTIELGVNTGQTEEVYFASFSPDEKTFITCGQFTVGVWDVSTGKLIRNILHKGGINSAEFSNDGKSLVIIPLFNNLVCYDLATGNVKYDIPRSRTYYQSQKSIDGKYIAFMADSAIDIIEPENGKLVFSIEPKSGFIINSRFNPDGSKFYFTTSDSSLYMHDVLTRKELLHSKKLGLITRMAISSDGKMLAVTDKSMAITIWNADFSKKIQQFSSPAPSKQLHFVDHDQRIVSLGKDSMVRIWNVQTGNLEKSIYSPNAFKLHITKDQTKGLLSDASDFIKLISFPGGIITDSIKCHEGYSHEAIYNSDGSKILSFGGDTSAILWDTQTKKPLVTSSPTEINVVKALFANDLKHILLVDANNTFTLWDKEKGLRNSSNKIDLNENLLGLFQLYCPKILFNGKYLLNTHGGEIKLLDPVTYEEPVSIKAHFDFIAHLEFNQTGDKIVSASWDSTAAISDVATGEVIYKLKGHSQEVTYASFSMDGSKVATCSKDSLGMVWDVATGKKLFELKGHRNTIHKISFNNAGTMVASQSTDSTIRAWDASTGKFLFEAACLHVLHSHFSISPNDQYIMTQTAYNVITIYDARNGNKLYDLGTHKSVVSDFQFSQDSKQIITTSWDRTCKLWDTQTGKEILTFINLPDNEWLVLHPSGLFDASASAMEKLYWVQGLDIIDFTQLKDRFYEPGLWSKVIGNENLREVKGFNEKIPLYPEIKLSPVDLKGDLKIELTNRGGGIGKVKIFINGKEVSDDVRGEKFNPEAAAATIVHNVKDHAYLIKGDTNLIEVKAYNKDNWVLSRGETLTYIDKRSKEEKAPELFVISIGVSDYQGKDIDLKFPSKDASDIYTSIQVGAKRLFGFEKTHGYLLNSTTDLKPTKENIKNIFSEIAKKANSNDVIVVYLSGHGINWGGDEGDWYYLTQDAFSASSEAYNDEVIRTKSGVSSKELSDWIKSIPALKQVLIIDACASGRVVEDLVAQRDIPANTIRSLDRMKDRTGLHIITGCAADAVSFEASRYGQGVLTYSLLEGMKGLSLREGKFVDIVAWFQYARERVPFLASGIGGIQEPQIISPNGSESFDIGQLDEEDKKLIPLSTIKPMYVRSNFQDEDDLDDVLALGDKMDEALNEFSSKGTESTIVFVDVKEFPDAYKLIGRYKRENNQVILTLKVKQGSEMIATLSITGTDANDVVNQLLKKINDF